MEADIQIIQNELANYGQYIACGQGVSMLPMLKQNQNVIKIVPKQGRLKKYDVALFSYRNKLVLHRVVAIREDGYDFCGDSTRSYERNVKEEDVIGVLTAFVHDSKKMKWIEVTDWKYRLFARIVVFFIPFKMHIHALKQRLKKGRKTHV